MAFARSWRMPVLIALFLSLMLALTGCATVPPQPIHAIYPSQTPTEAPQPTETPSGEQEPDAQEPAGSAGDSAKAPTQGAAVPQAPSGAVDHVEIFYSGMPSLMGFADAAQTTVYEHTMDALSACVSLCWPAATASHYRYGADIAKDAMRLDKEALLARIGEPSFYLDTAMGAQPARVKRAGEPVITAAEKMNEPIPSFYEAAGLQAPMAQSVLRGTPVAVRASDPAGLTVIVTDLHELRTDDGALLSALNERGLQAGRAVGVVAISSEYSGYVPDIGVGGTAFVWGDAPTGTRDYLVEYGEYSVGISIDPEQRAMASRPFYLLLIGEQAAVDTYIDALSQRLQGEFSANKAFKLRSATYGSGYVPAGYALGGSMRFTAGQGVTAIPDNAAPGGVSLIELKASREARFLEWEIAYRVHPSDPRGLSLGAEDFAFAASALSGDSAVVLPHVSWQVLRAEGDTVTLKLRLNLPEGILAQGSYTLELLGSLAAPTALPGSDWMDLFGYDADGAMLFDMEQNLTAFDGSRTLFLSRLIDTLGRANIGRLGVAPLGTVLISLTVYA